MEIVPTSQLRPADWNPRVIYTKDFQQLMRAISTDPQFLEARPVLAMQDGTIYAGEQRYRAVLQLYRQGWCSPWGFGMIPAEIEDLSLSQAKARAVRDNTHAGNWQEIELAEALTEIAIEQGSEMLPTLGLKDDELQNILASVGVGEAIDPISRRTMDPDAPQEPHSEPQGPAEPHDHPMGEDVAHGEPLTILLRFDDAEAWEIACRMLGRDEDGGLGIRYVELRAHDREGHER